MSIDLTTADCYLANDKCERGLQQLHPNDTPHHHSCEVHKAATCTTWALQPLDTDVSRLIAASLVLRNAGSLAKFRDTLLAVIRSSLVVNYAVCPTEPCPGIRSVLVFECHEGRFGFGLAQAACHPKGDSGSLFSRRLDRSRSCGILHTRRGHDRGASVPDP